MRLVQKKFRKNIIQIIYETFGSIKDIKILSKEKETIYFFKDNINKYEEKVFSQNGEDGVVLYLIEIIAKKYDLDKSYFEFGVEDGSECITRIIREKLDWKGTILDS